MMLKPLACTLLTVSVLTACSSSPPNQHSSAHNSKTPINEPFIFTEPEISPPFYALNPINYDEPPRFELALKVAAAQPVTKMVVPRPEDPSQSMTLEVNKLIIPTVNSRKSELKYAVLAGKDELDITEIDDFLQLVEGKARHYPPHFDNRQERKGYETKLKIVSSQLDSLAENPQASFDILLRAFKASVMGRNLDLGSSYTTKSLTYAQRLLKINPNDPEVNFWFGFGLSEGGGQREAIPYLNKAMQGGVQEAYLSSVNNYLAMEQKKNALQTLKNYKIKYPNEAEIADRLSDEINKKDRWNVWQILK